MTAHSVLSTTIERPSAVVFDAVHDYSRRLEWDTLLRGAYTEGDLPPGIGVVAVCSARWHLSGLTFATRYVTFRRPDLAAVTLVRPSFVFAVWSASIRHRDLPATTGAPASSEVSYTQTLRCRPRWLSRPLEYVAIGMFRRETRRRLRALKQYLEDPARVHAPGG